MLRVGCMVYGCMLMQKSSFSLILSSYYPSNSVRPQIINPKVKYDFWDFIIIIHLFLKFDSFGIPFEFTSIPVIQIITNIIQYIFPGKSIEPAKYTTVIKLHLF